MPAGGAINLPLYRNENIVVSRHLNRMKSSESARPAEPGRKVVNLRDGVIDHPLQSQPIGPDTNFSYV